MITLRRFTVIGYAMCQWWGHEYCLVNAVPRARPVIGGVFGGRKVNVEFISLGDWLYIDKIVEREDATR